MITVYGYSCSGNCHKLKLLLTQLAREFKWVEIDSTCGETRTPEYLAKNPNGRVPMIELEDGRILTESNAILCWLAEGTPYWAGDAWQRAQVLSWMFFEQYSHEPYIAVARFIRGWTQLDSPRRATLAQLRERGHQALAVMEQHLAAGHAWFSGDAYGIADIALFAYTVVADEGGFDLAAYPQLRDWLGRVMKTPGFVAMPAPPVEVASRLALSD
ncbi:glutathione S-transferase family protein [Lysobacter sp. TAF61]|uniref:glutathione S-transferase family protein n=1 Tax=Lysobacter sp. TAF61 TaxID=3233072 RepID=UPI003F98CEC0